MSEEVDQQAAETDPKETSQRAACWSVVDSSGAGTGFADGEESPSCDAEEIAAEEDNGPAICSKWEEMFKRLVAFHKEHGHCLVPNRYSEDPQLGSWVSSQRRQYKVYMSSDANQSTGMSAERAHRLEQIGFQWSTKDPRHVPWDRRFQELMEFFTTYGHAQVPIGWKENVQLSNWVSTQRQEYKLLQKGRTTRLTQERIERLNKINFVWEAQRGGPRRHKRATVCVPPRANPVQAKDPAAKRKSFDVAALSITGRSPTRAGGRGGSFAAASVPVAPQSQPGLVFPGQALAVPAEAAVPEEAGAADPSPPQGLRTPAEQAVFQQRETTGGDIAAGVEPVAGMAATAVPMAAARASSGALGIAALGQSAAALGIAPPPPAAGIQAAPAAALGLAAAAQPATGLNFAALHPYQAAALAGLPHHAVAQLGAGSLRTVDLGLSGAAATHQPWQMLQNGAFQQNGALGLGIFPIATPLPIAAAGYQLGMVPTALLQQGVAAAASGLHHPFAFGVNAGRKKRRKRRKRRRRRRREETAEKDQEESSQSSDEDDYYSDS